MVFDFVDNASQYNMPYSMHRLFRLKEYKPGALVLGTKGQKTAEQGLYDRGERPDALFDWAGGRPGLRAGGHLQLAGRSYRDDLPDGVRPPGGCADRDHRAVCPGWLAIARSGGTHERTPDLQVFQMRKPSRSMPSSMAGPSSTTPTARICSWIWCGRWT